MTTRERAWTKKQANPIVSNTDEGTQTKVEGKRLIISNTDEHGSGVMREEATKRKSTL